MDKHLNNNRVLMGKKSWKEINKKNKVIKKKYREENLLRKMEKLKKNNEKELLNAINNDDEIIINAVNQNSDKKRAEISTVSIALPGSILENAQSPQLRSYLAGQIARAACIYNIDEIIVFDDCGNSQGSSNYDSNHNGHDNNDPNHTNSNGVMNMGSSRYSSIQLARILQYLECPQYLRKYFFPLHKDLQFCGLLNPLDAPHHLRQQNDFIFREGVVTDKPPKENRGSFVNIGLRNDCLVDKVLQSGLRVTVRLLPNQDLTSKKIKGIIVSPSEPRLTTGIYWGYTVRIASSFSDILLKSPYKNGYDLTIGTSDKGTNVHDELTGDKTLSYNHALIVYGGVKGLEIALENDDKLLDVNDPELIFNHYLNVVPNQGSRTIRTEEAILISLAVLDSQLIPVNKPKKFCFKTSIPQSNDTGNKQFEFNKPKRKLSDKKNVNGN